MSSPAITCIVLSHDKPELVRQAIWSVLAQTFTDWEAIVFDSGVLHDAGFFTRLPGMDDPRIRLVRSWETPEIRRTKAIAPWCFNECLRSGLVRGDLVAYLTDDDLFYPNAFATFVECRRSQPAVQAMYAGEDVYVLHADGRSELVGERRALHVGGQCCGGHTLAGFADYLQFCHTRELLARFPSDEYWPEALGTQQYGDALFMERVGSLVPVVPIDVKIGQNRRTPRSKYAPSPARATGAAPFRCSLIVPALGGAQRVARTLEGVAALAGRASYEVIVIDDASSDGTADFLATLGGDVRVLRNAAPTGFAAAANRAAAVAHGEYLVLLQAGAVPAPGWLDALVAEADGAPQVAVVGTKLIDGANRVRHAGIAFAREDGTPYAVYRGRAADDPAVNHQRELQAVAGGAILVRRDPFAAVGGLDMSLGTPAAMIDLCLRLGALGRGVSYQPQAVLHAADDAVDEDFTADAAALGGSPESTPRADEDTIYPRDGYACVRERGAMRLLPLATPEERVRWARVGFVQRFARWGELDTVRPLLRRPEDWPADAAVLRWAVGMCARAGVDAAGFTQRLSQLEAA
jgi:GT2 family glycosyltransferase